METVKLDWTVSLCLSQLSEPLANEIMEDYYMNSGTENRLA